MQMGDALDRSSFVSQVIEMMSNVVGNGTSKKRLETLQKPGGGVKNRVEEARFALGGDDGAYLRANVMPLQTTLSNCDDRPLVEGLSPEIRNATQIGVVSAMEEASHLRIKGLQRNLQQLVKPLALGLSLLHEDRLEYFAMEFDEEFLDVAKALRQFNGNLTAGIKDLATIYDPLDDFVVAYEVANYMNNNRTIVEEMGRIWFSIRNIEEGSRAWIRTGVRLPIGDDEWKLFESPGTSGTFNPSYYGFLKKIIDIFLQYKLQVEQLEHLTEIKKQLDNDAKNAKSTDDFNKGKRRAVWNDALRESCISQDRLYAFVRQLSGTISENVDAVCLIDEGLLVRQQREQREGRQRLATQAAQEQMTLVRNVFGAVLRDSGLSLGIDTKDSTAELKVVSSTLRKQASELASGAAGTTGGYFTNAVRLENLLGSGTGEITLQELFEKLGTVGNAIQKAAFAGDSQYEEEDTASLDFLSAPRNSLLLRYKPEALSAIRQAFQLFQREMQYQGGRMTRRISAFELVEGNDDELSTAFATFSAHVLVHSRMYSSGTAMYIGAWPAAANAQQLKISLQRLVSCAQGYAWHTSTPAFGAERGREAYFSSARGSMNGMYMM